MKETKKKVMKNKKRKAKIRLRVYIQLRVDFLLITLVVVCFDLFSPPKTFFRV